MNTYMNRKNMHTVKTVVKNLWEPVIILKHKTDIELSGLWLKGQASYGRKAPRKLIRKAAVSMA